MLKGIIPITHPHMFTAHTGTSALLICTETLRSL